VSVTPLDGPWIPATHYRSNRSRMKWGRVIFLGTHTAEGGSTARALGLYFQKTTRDVSSHCGIGQAGDYAEYVRYSHTAFTMPPVNDDTDNCELMGFAAWSRTTWLSHKPMLDKFSHWLAWRSEVRKIPLHVLSASEAKAGQPGILMHRTATLAWGQSDHTDPGPNFPWDYVLPRAKDIRDDMPTTKEIADAVAKELLSSDFVHQFAEKFLNQDGIIPNSFPGTDPANTHLTPRGVAVETGEEFKRLRSTP
jgi:hypothetical protein